MTATRLGALRHCLVLSATLFVACGESHPSDLDASTADSAIADGGVVVDTGPARDSGSSTDGGSMDGGSTDGGSMDAGSADGGPMDGGSTDGGPVDPLCVHLDGGSVATAPAYFELRADRTAYYPDDTITLHGLVRNLTDRAVYYTHDAFEGLEYRVSGTGPGDEPLALIVTPPPEPEPGPPPSIYVCDRMHNGAPVRTLPTAADPETPEYLPLNRIVEDLASFYDLSAIGDYEITITARFATYHRVVTSVDGVDHARLDEQAYCCSLVSSTARFTIAPRAAELIEAGRTYGTYVVHSIVPEGATPGDYTFHVANPTAGSVEVRRDGAPVTTLGYVWTTTVHATNPEQYYTFSFPGLFHITVRKSGSGTQNLYAIDHSIFDGARILRIP